VRYLDLNRKAPESWRKVIRTMPPVTSGSGDRPDAGQGAKHSIKEAPVTRAIVPQPGLRMKRNMEAAYFFSGNGP
jgi:hypothetical protein